MSTFPNLTQTVRFMLQDNYGSLYKQHVLPESRWAFDTLGNVGDLEAQAAALTDEERETLAAGEESEQKAIVKKHKCAALNDALARMFDGDLEHLVKKPTKPATAKKPAAKKAKPAKGKETVRVRALRALLKGGDLTASEVATAVGINHTLKPTLDEEVAKGTLKSKQLEGVTVYTITGKGKAALEAGTVDPVRGSSTVGQRVTKLNREALPKKAE